MIYNAKNIDQRLKGDRFKHKTLSCFDTCDQLFEKSNLLGI